ncbi:AI-2E family transporter [Corynebacterium falsenii]|uniref:AI-2E family transporter n=2 Tax=Corynebacterium falsenii TaxID=108486 RepID=UPI00234CDEA9|nr:AI-2E family transporter [Corynebacterium falsenii]MDC7104628.1 AI-2E family transporter [Corynebacterium falsenii]
MSPHHDSGTNRGNHSDRDFADFLAGSDRLDPQAQLPIPDDHKQKVHPAVYTEPSETVGKLGTAYASEVKTARQTTGDAEPLEDQPEPSKAKSAVDEDLRPELRDRAEVIGTSVRWFAGWCVRFIIMIAAAYLAAMAFGKLWAGILPVVLSIIVCTVLWPVVRFLRQKAKFPKALAVLVTILGFFALIAGVFALIAPGAVDQSRTLINQANGGVRTIQNWLQGPPLNLQESQFNDYLDQATNWIQNKSGDIATTVATGAAETVSMLATLLIMLVLTFFFLKDGENFLPMVRRVTGRRVGWHLTEVLTRCWNTLGGFIRTQAIVSLIDAFFIGLGLVILNVPLAGALAFLTFCGGFIPIVGAFVAGTLSVLVALVANGFTTALIVLAIIIAVQQLEGNVLSPVLQSRAMNVHAVIILLAVTLGSALFGIVGAFLAVPTAAMLAVIFRYMGDLTDLATGEKTADEIAFATRAGSLTGEQSEQAARRWQALRNNAFRNLHDVAHSDSDSNSADTGSAGVVGTADAIDVAESANASATTSSVVTAERDESETSTTRTITPEGTSSETSHPRHSTEDDEQPSGSKRGNMLRRLRGKS